MKNTIKCLAFAAIAALSSVLAGATEGDTPLFTPVVSAAPTLTVAQKQSRVSGRLLSQSRSTYAQLCRAQKEAINQVWHNTDGLTPQQAFDALGTKAGALVAAHAKVTTLIAELSAVDGVAPDILLPTHAFTVHPDGTVTVLEGPYVP